MTTTTKRRTLGGPPGVCGRCKATITWARTVAGPNGPGGKSLPLDPNEDPEGNVAVRRTAPGRLQARVLGKDEDHDHVVETRAMPHFATCEAKAAAAAGSDDPAPITRKPTTTTTPTSTPAAVTGPPKRIQCRRTKGWTMPPNTVYVGRPTRWGNEFVIGETTTITQDGHTQAFRVASRAHAVALYRQWQAPEDADLARRELRGKNLACWCPPDQPCHADVLLDLANQETP